MHSEKEKSKIRIQVTKTLGVLRDFMWDEKLIVSGKDFGIGVYCEKLEEFLWKNPSRKLFYWIQREKKYSMVKKRDVMSSEEL
ncbi:MAG: hypothetical protein RMH75_03355 [Archaeoglobaceae archaeon]|nr:hypothetical protein [Archaeoglobaceae archaeon]MDW7989693.1 hypothetical protein [Archaeoglobaceae archaeon]